ncbi:hypothetical protein MKX01_038927 [Papaver californicum]|nr:hypothetical protein MKX01_038927 [Papaver californicum]
MGKGPGLYTNIGKIARDLSYKDYQSDQKFSVTTYSENGVAICSSGTKKGELFLADVNTQLKQKNITADIKVDTNSRDASSIGLTANPVVNFSGLFGNSQTAVGTDVSFGTTSGNFGSTMNDKCDNLNVSYYQTLTSPTNASVGAELTYSISRSESTLTIGAQHALDQQTAVKAKLNSSGIVNALIQHEIYPKSHFTISGEVDTKAIEKSAKFGLALALKP